MKILDNIRIKYFVKMKLLNLLVLTLIFQISFLPAIASSKQKPNVILILTDDQGSIDLNCYGASDLHTPNLDNLAESGVKFSRFYVGSAVCSPSRASLLTGKTPHSAGLPGNAKSKKGHDGMPSEQVTIAEMMKTDGYATAHIGKWHLGYSEKTRPLNQGFDYSFGHMGGCIDNYSHFFYWAGPNQHDLWENGKEIYRDGEYFPDMAVDKAQTYIKEHKDQPFFMYVALNTPHYPLQPTKKWREYYKDLPMPRRDYAAFVSTTDERIGQIIETVDELELRENTIIIYLSDHGHSYEERTFGGGGNAGPFRGGKASLFEGGIRVPAIISWKGKLPEGKTVSQPCLSMDLLPTINDLCDLSTLPKEVEGTSIKKTILTGKPSKHDVFHWKLGNQWAISKDNWKLIGNPVDPSILNKNKRVLKKDPLFLSNLQQDSTEQVNLAEKYPDKVEELIQLYLKWEHAEQKDIPTLHRNNK
jgi:arylsulfatase A